MSVIKNMVLAAAATVVAGAFASATVRAQDPVKVAPENYKVVLENDHIRVCEVHAKPGAKIAMHAHPDHIAYTLAGGKIKFTYPEGKGQPKELDQKPGQARWIPAETHAGEYTGKDDLHVVVFELKGHAASTEAEKTIKEVPEHAKVLLENERVRVIETMLKPGQKSAMHSYPANVVFAITAAKVKFTDAQGATTEKELTAGQAFWSEPVQHAVENVGTSDIRPLNVELKGLTRAEGKP